jgi:hypothetical protein
MTNRPSQALVTLALLGLAAAPTACGSVAPCQNSCAVEGSTKCTGASAVSSCTRTVDGCLVFADPAPCAAGQVCGSGQCMTGTGTGTPPPTPTPATLYTRSCASCHGAQAEGRLGPNISGSPTAGIGLWTSAQFLTALRSGVDDAGRTFCRSMPTYSAVQISDAQVAELFAYVTAFRVDTPQQGSECP